MDVLYSINRVTIITMDKMVSPRPAMAIWGMVSWPLAITLALGPVSGCSIKTQDAAIVAGTINKKGARIWAPFQAIVRA